MYVILQQDIKSLGKKGQKVKVSDGYANNFLFPKKLAIEANAANLNTLKTQEASIAFKKETERQNALMQKNTIEGTVLSFAAKAGANGKLFGAITTKEIAEQLKVIKKITVDKKKIKLINVDSIKAYGTYIAEIKLYPDIIAKITITITEQ